MMDIRHTKQTIEATVTLRSALSGVAVAASVHLQLLPFITSEVIST